MNRFAHNRHRHDTNHRVIVTVLKDLGCSVLDCSQGPERGAPDLLVGMAGVNYLAELKAPGEALRHEQLEWHEAWRGERPVTLWSAAQAIAWVNAMRRRARRCA